jgi:hypothetical protein
VPMIRVREISSPIALAACGAFLVPEPLGICFVLAAGIWWLWRKIRWQQIGFFERSADAVISAGLAGKRTVALIRTVQRLFTLSISGPGWASLRVWGCYCVKNLASVWNRVKSQGFCDPTKRQVRQARPWRAFF